MFKKCIITSAEVNPTIHAKMRSYAKKINADFFTTIPQNFSDYDLFLFLSSFIAIREDCPDLFDIVPCDKIGILQEKRFDPTKDYSLDVIVARKEQALELMFATNQIEYLKKNEKKIFGLSYKYNRMECMDAPSGEHRLASYMINYSNATNEMIERDMLEWKPPYEYKQYLALITDGCGIGDLTCVEPIARFCRDKLFKDENFIIVSDYPELYEHLNVPIHSNTGKVENAFNYRKLTCFAPESDGSIHHEVLSHPQMNSTDYSSMLAIKYQLSVEDKQITLSDNTHLIPEELQKILKKSVLVHAGLHWPSKTFPVSWWQEVIEHLADNGINIVLLGKEITKDQGVQPLKCTRPNIVSIVNQFTLRQVIGAIKLAPAVLTNDSMPIHIAGAFDNWIFPILSCKKFEHVMPFRNGQQNYKVKMLNKGYVFDYKTNRLNQLDGFKIDKCSVEAILNILPTKEEVLEAIKCVIN